MVFGDAAPKSRFVLVRDNFDHEEQTEVEGNYETNTGH
jgi:hypothetical protein